MPTGGEGQYPFPRDCAPNLNALAPRQWAEKDVRFSVLSRPAATAATIGGKAVCSGTGSFTPLGIGACRVGSARYLFRPDTYASGPVPFINAQWGPVDDGVA